MRNLQGYSQKSLSNKNFISKFLKNPKDLEKLKNRAVKDFLDSVARIDEGASIFFYGGRPIRSCPADIVRVIAESPQKDTNILLVRNIILNSVMSLEAKSVFSGYAFSRLLEGQKASSYRQRAELKEALFLIRKHLGSGMCYDIVKSVAMNRGIVKKINFVLTDSKRDIVLTKKSEWSLRGIIPEDFSSCFFESKSSKKVDEARILFIDGSVERVSELHHLLETSSNTTDFGVIIAHRFSPDVITTLVENYKSGKLKIIPFLCEPNEDLLESFYRSGITTISTDSGEVLSSLSFDNLETRKDCVFYRNEMSILNLEVQKNNIHYTVEIPPHFHKLSGVIEDRVRAGLKYFYEISKYGIALDDSQMPIFGLKQYKEAEKFTYSFSKTMNDLGVLIVVE